MAQERMKQTEIGETKYRKRWKEMKLGDIAKSNLRNIDKSYPYQEILYLDTGSITENKVSSLQLFKIKEAPSRAKRLVKNNNIIYSTVRPIQRHYGFIKKPPENLVVSTGFAVIETNNKFANPLFIYFLLSLKDVIEELDTIAEGATYPAIKPKNIENLQILLPPLSEQQKIAAVLSKIQQSIDAKEDLIKTTKELKKSMMQCLFIHGTKNEKTKQTEAGEIPESWGICRLENICEFKNGLWKGKNSPLQEVSIIRNTDFQKDGKLDLSNVAVHPVEVRQLKDRLLSKGDIILENSGGSKNRPVGRVVYFEAHDDKIYSYGNFTSRITIKANNINSKYLYNILNYFHSIGKTSSIQSGTSGIKNLDKKAYKRLYIPLPLLSEQKKIASILSKIDERIQNYENQKSALQALFKSMLNKLMTGQIRVHKLDIDVSEVE